MNRNKHSKKLTLFFLFLFLCATHSPAQATKFTQPREERLLNGLKLLFWNQPNTEKVSVKIRIHSGAAFDPQNKEGTMALLADAMFPNESVKEFFREDLGGSLSVTSNFDYIQIDASANSEQFLPMLESLAAAVSNPQIDKETTATIRAARIEKVKEMEKDSAYVADQAVAKRLFGDFPYGKAQDGTSASLPKIDFADLLQAKEKFFTPDNATVAIAGNVKPDFAFRAARRLFGAWVKSDKKVPATFRQADIADEKSLTVNSATAENSQIRFAIRGLRRSDKDFYASLVLIKILQNRLQSSLPKDYGKEIFVRQAANLLPGSIVFGYASQTKTDAAAAVNSPAAKSENVVGSILKSAASAEEFSRAKSEILNDLSKRDAIESWLDADTFKLASAQEDAQRAANATIEDVNKLIENFRKQPVVTVYVTKQSEETSPPKN